MSVTAGAAIPLQPLSPNPSTRDGQHAPLAAVGQAGCGPITNSAAGALLAPPAGGPSPPPPPTTTVHSKREQYWAHLRTAWGAIDKSIVLLMLIFAAFALRQSLSSADDGRRSREAAEWANDKEYREYCEEVILGMIYYQDT